MSKHGEDPNGACDQANRAENCDAYNASETDRREETEDRTGAARGARNCARADERDVLFPRGGHAGAPNSA